MKTQIWEVEEYKNGEYILFERNEHKQLWVNDGQDTDNWWLLKENIKSFREFERAIDKCLNDY